MIIQFDHARHVPARQSSHRVGVVLVLDAHPFFQDRVVELSRVTRRIDVRIASAKEFVDHNSVLRRKTRGFRQFDVRLNTDARDDAIDKDFSTGSGRKGALVSAHFRGNNLFSGTSSTPFCR